MAIRWSKELPVYIGVGTELAGGFQSLEPYVPAIGIFSAVSRSHHVACVTMSLVHVPYTVWYGFVFRVKLRSTPFPLLLPLLVTATVGISRPEPILAVQVQQSLESSSSKTRRTAIENSCVTCFRRLRHWLFAPLAVPVQSKHQDSNLQ